MKSSNIENTENHHPDRHTIPLLLITVREWSAGTARQPDAAFFFLVGAVMRIPPRREAATNSYSRLIPKPSPIGVSSDDESSFSVDSL